MAKTFYIGVLVLIVALVSGCTAEPPRSRRPGRIESRLHLSARQEAAPTPAPTEATPAPSAAPRAPYAPAGVTPQVPFDLPAEAQPKAAQPDQSYGAPPPDATYGPPQSRDVGGGEGAGEAEQEPATTYLPPDTTYGPPPAAAGADAALAQEASDDLVSQNLLQPRPMLSSRLRVAPAARRSQIVEIIRSEPVLVYTLQ